VAPILTTENFFDGRASLDMTATAFRAALSILTHPLTRLIASELSSLFPFQHLEQNTHRIHTNNMVAIRALEFFSGIGGLVGDQPLLDLPWLFHWRFTFWGHTHHVLS